MVATGAAIIEENNNNPFSSKNIQKRDSSSSENSMMSTLNGLKKNSFDGKYKYWIDPSDYKYVRWVIFLLIVNMIWIHVTLPVRLSLFEGTVQIALSIKILDLLCDLLNTADMLMQFAIPLLDTSGGWNAGYVFERKHVIYEYLKSWFFFDLLGNIPYSFFDMEFYPKTFLVFMSMKMFRVRKAHYSIKKLVRKMGFGVVSVKFTLSCWNLLMMLHLTACIWGTVGQVNLVNGD